MKKSINKEKKISKRKQSINKEKKISKRKKSINKEKKISKRKKSLQKSYNINFSEKKLSHIGAVNNFSYILSKFGYGYDMNKTLIKNRNELLDKYKTILIKKKNGYYLPKGIKLYHCSLENSFVVHDSISFFGLDSNISLWYCIEQDLVTYFEKKCIELKNITKQKIINCINNYYSNDYSSKKKYGYLYTFITQKDIKIKIIKNIINQPKLYSHCMKKKNVCFHPQFSYRGIPNHKNTPKIYGLSIEVTLFYPVYKDKLKLLKREKVDINKLFKNRNDKNYKPQNAIIKSSLKEYNK